MELISIIWYCVYAEIYFGPENSFRIFWWMQFLHPLSLLLQPWEKFCTSAVINFSCICIPLPFLAFLNLSCCLYIIRCTWKYWVFVRIISVILANNCGLWSVHSFKSKQSQSIHYFKRQLQANRMEGVFPLRSFLPCTTNILLDVLFLHVYYTDHWWVTVSFTWHWSWKNYESKQSSLT